MNIASFDDLLNAARYQPLPQRLLFVFASIELPEDSTPQQRADYEAGHGGTLTPLMCVDKSPQELDSFAALAAEASQTGQKWGMVFAAAMSGTVGNPPTNLDAELPLQRMVEAIKSGDIDGYIPFDPQGLPVQLHQ
ncbi:MAG: ribonucleotide reductase subunit alpha [Rhodoferax sp.]